MQGRSIREVVAGNRPEDWPDVAYHRYWMHRDPEHNAYAHYGVRDQRYKLIYWYNEGFDLPDAPEYRRVRAWREACLSHAAAQQVTREEIVKLYYDYALGAGNGALVAGRRVSSFTFTPPWQDRPWPPRDKYAGTASDADLGLVA